MLLLALACLAGCNQSTVPPYTGVLSGVYDLVLVGDLLFITSSDKNELRVFDTSLNPRDFVRAPNPLEPLSIPVVARPVGVVRDVHYDSKGAEVGGPYVYAYGTAEPFISVVGADRTLLREMLPAGTPGTTLSRLKADGPVSAIAAHGPNADTDFPANHRLDASRLFYATAVGNEGRLYSVDLAAPDAIDGSNPQPRLLQTLTGEFVTALAAMPDPNRVVVATRSQSGRGGRTYVLDITNGSLEPLQFPYPVRRVVVTPGAKDPENPDGPFVVEPGANVFGVFDEESCGASSACNGILAVETYTGAVAFDGTGQKMLPLQLGLSLTVGLHIAQNAYVVSNAVSNTASFFPLLGMGTASDGRIFFFDAFTMRHIDADPGLPTTAVQLRAPDDTSVTFDATKVGPVQLGLSEGAAHTETISVVKEGAFPGMVNVPSSDADGLRFPVSAPALADVGVGDTIVITRADSTACEDVAVVAKDAAAVYADHLPANCAGRTAFTVRGGNSSDKPYVVSGTVSGYMGRAKLDQVFTFSGSYYYHPTGFDPSAPMISFKLQGPEDPRVVRDWKWVIGATSGILTLSFAIDTTYPTLTQYILPGSIVSVPGTTIAFVAYPSASGLIEFNPPLIIPGQANNRNIVPYP